MIRYIRYSVVLFVVLMCLYPLGVKADTIAYLSYGKLWVYEAGKSRLVGDAQFVDVKWYKKPTVAAVHAGNIELVDTTNGRSEKLTSIGNIRNILVLPDKKKIVFSRLTGDATECAWQHEICSVSITDKKITRIRKLWVVGDVVLEWTIIGDKVYYLSKIDADDQLVVPRSVLMQLDLSTAKVKSLYTTKQGNEFLTICRSWDQTKIVILGYEFQIRFRYDRENDVTYQESVEGSERFYIAQLKLPKPRLTISHRFGQDFPVDRIGGALGSCMLSDGSLVFGTRNFSYEDSGAVHESSRLYRFSFESGETTQIANGYRPDAISE